MIKQSDKNNYVKFFSIQNINIIRLMSFIILNVFGIYFILGIAIKGILPDNLKNYYTLVYLISIIMSLLYLVIICILKKKCSIRVIRYFNLTAVSIYSFCLICLSTLDSINTNEIIPFIMAQLILAIIYRETNLILVNLLSGNALLLIFLLHSFTGTSLGILRIIDILVYSLISIVLAFLNNKSHKKNYHISVKLEEKTKELEILSYRDSLTGVFNRRYLYFILENEKSRFLRNAKSFSIMMADIDHFKKINDSFGHLTGDSVLFEFSAIVTGVCRDEDIITRFGGEEFLIILIGASKKTACSAAERLRKEIEDYTFKGVPYPVTVSIGIAEFSGNENIDELIKKADEKLYLAKRKGRNRIES
ncbi:MAG: diguanylate cyclase [Spirochaetes bacterium]|nr:diguanylate cyclase [Spirochaetota bacterium]